MAIALTVSSNVTPGQNHHYLNKWVEVMMEDIWHFNQCAGIGAPVNTANDKGGLGYLQTEREYIARSLETAALRMADDLNYWICPAYFREEIKLGRGAPIQNQAFQGRWLKLIELGKRGITLIQAAVPVTYSDPNNIGVDDTATVVLNTTVANDEIKLFFQVSDGAKTAGDARYEIEPTTVIDAAGVVTITAHRALFVKPSEWARPYIAYDPNQNTPNVIDTGSAANFVTQVDVYRVYTDTSSNIELMSNDNTLLQTYTGDVISEELSAFRMGDLCGSFCYDKYPAKVWVNYKAGSPLVNNEIDSELFESAVAYACANMESKLSKMSYWALEHFNRWHNPMMQKVGNEYIPIATKKQADSNYGALAGQVRAWGTVLDRRIERGGKFF